MKPQKLYIPLLALLLAIYLTGCEKNNPFAPGTELPPETTTGANTFGCLVNGKVWRNGGYFNPAESLNMPEMTESRLQIATSRSVTDTLSGIGIYIFTSNIGIGQYLCDSLNVNIYFHYGIGGPTGSYCDYEYAKDGLIEITRYDLENRIVSGRFSAKLQVEGCEDIVITEGSFDLKQ
jgi:hypothetical protein